MHRVLDRGGRAGISTVDPMPPLLGALAGALHDQGHPEGSGFLGAVFSLHDPDEIGALVEAAGFHQVDVQVISLPLDLPPPRPFLWKLLCSTPLAVAAARMDDLARASLEHAVLPGGRGCLSDGLFAIAVPTVIATGRA